VSLSRTSSFLENKRQKTSFACPSAGVHTYVLLRIHAYVECSSSSLLWQIACPHSVKLLHCKNAGTPTSYYKLERNEDYRQHTQEYIKKAFVATHSLELLFPPKYHCSVVTPTSQAASFPVIVAKCVPCEAILIVFEDIGAPRMRSKSIRNNNFFVPQS
jgi:hypothetical protein